MKKIEGKAALKIHVINFIAMGTTWGALGLIVGGALGIWLDSGLIFGVVLVSTPFILNYIFSSKRIKKINSAYQYMGNAVKSKLKKTDYYNMGAYGAIAVDVENKEISIINADQKFKFKEPFVFNAEKIKNYKSYVPEYSELDTIAIGNVDIKTQENIINQNFQAKAKAYAESGLYIDLDDISNPQVFVQMEYSEATKWLLILEKLLNGTLDTQSTSMLYPPLQ